MNVFDAIGTILNSAVTTFTTASRTIEKAVVLLENEVDNLDLEQQLRLDRIKAERADLTAERAKRLAKVKP